MLERQGLGFRWDDQDNLTTECTVPAIVRDPATGRECLNIAVFNTDTFLSNIGRFAERYTPCVRRLVQWFIRREGAKRDVFMRTVFGDGCELGRAESEEIQRAAWDHAICFPWKRGDLLLLSNIRFGHSRVNVTGKRRIATAMANPLDIRDLV